MARGDYYDVWLRGEAKPRRVQATTMGASVGLDLNLSAVPKIGSMAQSLSPDFPFFTLYELDMTGKPKRTFQFAKDQVVAIEQGGEVLGGKKK